MAKKEATASNYSATIIDASRELTARERVMFKDTQNAISINDFAEQAKSEGGKAIIENVKDYVHISVHNDKSDDKDYDNYMIIDGAGDKYVTGSQAFWNSFMDIYNEMKDETEPWGIQLNLIPSKNYKGKNVLTCSLV
jgi:hypothetical protein